MLDKYLLPRELPHSLSVSGGECTNLFSKYDVYQAKRDTMLNLFYMRTY